jgi:uncharacterized membrane protein YcaP (DUF421 family)
MLDLIFDPNMSWRELFVPDKSIFEIVLRGSITYLSLFLMLRFVLKREAGSMGITDLLVIVLIADAAQNAMSADYHSVTDGILLVAVIIGWALALDWLGYHVPWLQRILKPPPLLLIKNGKMIRRNMRQELITEEELKSQLRQQGVEHVSEVKRACIEENGQLSIVPFDKGQKVHPKKDQAH